MQPVRRTTRRLAAAGASVLLAAGLTACSGSDEAVQADPAGALSDAAAAFSDYEGVELTLRLEGDEAALAAEVDDPEVVRLLLDSTVTVRARGDGADDAQVEVVVGLGGRDAFEMRAFSEDELYFRVDLDAIADVVDDPELRSGIDEMVGMAGMFGLGDAARAAAEGRWIALTGLDQLAQLGGVDVDEPTDAEAEEIRQRLADALQRFLGSDVTVEALGTEPAGERVRATTDGAALQRLVDEIVTIVADVSGVDQGQLDQFDAEEIPADTRIVLDAWIADGRLTQVGFDLSELDDGPPAGTLLLVEIAEFTGDIAVPDDPEPLDLFAILGGFLGGMDDLGGAGPDDADDLAGDCIPQDQLDALLEMGGEDAAAELEAAIEAGLITVC
jgi:hypothetical protein